MLAVLGGCARTPEQAYVDLDRVQASAVLLQPDGFPHNPPQFEPTERAIQGMPGGVVLTPDAQDRTDEAIQRLRDQQERSHRRLLARLRAVYQEEIDRLSAQQRTELEAELREAEAALSGQARTLFEQTAQRVGVMRVELARLAGHPDTDPRSVRTATDPESMRARELARAAELRRSIQSLKERYRIEKLALYEQVQEAYREQLTSALAQALEMKALREIEAEAEAARWLLETQAFLPAGDIGMALEAAEVPPAESRTLPSRRWVAPQHNPSPPVRGEDVGRLAKMFVSLRGYRWSDETGVGTDLTEEFIAWKDQDPPGP